MSASRIRRAGSRWRSIACMAVALLATALLASCTSAAPGGHGAPGAERVITLNRITTLKTLFNRAFGRTRLILIFSPT